MRPPAVAVARMETMTRRLAMLVLSRQRDETIYIGTERTVMFDVTEQEWATLQAVLRQAPKGMTLARRLADVEPGRVEVSVVDIRGDKVRLGTEAPAHITVHRKEVAAAIARESRAAEQVSSLTAGVGR